MTGLSKVDGWLGSKTSSYKFPEAYMTTQTPQETKTKDLGLAATAAFQAGGGEDSQGDEKLDQEVASMLQQGASPQDVVQKLIQSGVPQDKATQIVQEVVQQLQQQQQPQQQQGQPQQQPTNQAGGDDSPQDDNDGQQAELEEGENYQTPQGDINKVPEGAGTHEEGGVQVPNAAKVLEDTSDKRKDKASKLLKIAPKQVESMLAL